MKNFLITIFMMFSFIFINSALAQETEELEMLFSDKDSTSYFERYSFKVYKVLPPPNFKEAQRVHRKVLAIHKDVVATEKRRYYSSIKPSIDTLNAYVITFNSLPLEDRQKSQNELKSKLKDIEDAKKQALNFFNKRLSLVEESLRKISNIAWEKHKKAYGYDDEDRETYYKKLKKKIHYGRV